MATKVILKNTRLSYPHLFEPQRAQEEGAKEKYSSNFLWSKSDTDNTAKVKEAIDAEIEAGMQSKFGGKINKTNFHNPLRDGDIERPDDPAYAGMYFINASSHNRPGIVDRNVDPIIDKSEVYSGCYGNVSINLYPFAVNGKKGIGCGLNHVQKVKDGEPLGGTSRPEDDFTVEAGDDFGTPKSSKTAAKPNSIWD